MRLRRNMKIERHAWYWKTSKSKAISLPIWLTIFLAGSSSKVHAKKAARRYVDKAKYSFPPYLSKMTTMVVLNWGAEQHRRWDNDDYGIETKWDRRRMEWGRRTHLISHSIDIVEQPQQQKKRTWNVFNFYMSCERIVIYVDIASWLDWARYPPSKHTLNSNIQKSSLFCGRGIYGWHKT